MTHIKEDCLDYSIDENGNLVVSIVNEEEVESILHKDSSDLYNFYYLTDQQKEEGGFYFTTLLELWLSDQEIPVFVEHWYQTESGKFYYSWRIWFFNNTETQYSALADLLYYKKIVFEFCDRIVDIEDIEKVALDYQIELTHTDKYNIYDYIRQTKYNIETRSKNSYDFILEAINQYCGIG